MSMVIAFAFCDGALVVADGRLRAPNGNVVTDRARKIRPIGPSAFGAWVGVKDAAEDVLERLSTEVARLDGKSVHERLAALVEEKWQKLCATLISQGQREDWATLGVVVAGLDTNDRPFLAAAGRCEVGTVDVLTVKPAVYVLGADTREERDHILKRASEKVGAVDWKPEEGLLNSAVRAALQVALEELNRKAARSMSVGGVPSFALIRRGFPPVAGFLNDEVPGV